MPKTQKGKSPHREFQSLKFSKKRSRKTRVDSTNAGEENLANPINIEEDIDSFYLNYETPAIERVKGKILMMNPTMKVQC